MDSVKRYKLRRDARLKRRGFRMDADEEGEWKTTDNGHKILIKDGVVVGGNPFALACMGAPEGKEMPKTAKRSDDQRIQDFVRKADRNQLADALEGHKGNCIFGGFYKVDNGTFFNPYTGEEFGITTDLDYAGPWGMEKRDDKLGGIIGKISVNNDAKKLYDRCHGIVNKGDTVRVVAGRTLEHGTEAKVRAVYDGKFGKYAYLDNGEKIQVKNLSIVDEDGTLIRAKEGKEHEELKDTHAKYREERKERDKAKKVIEVTQADVQKAVGSAKTRKTVVDALKKAGYNVQDNTDDSLSTVDVRIMRPDGTYVRIYKDGKDLKFQDWKKWPEEKLKSDSEIRDAKYFAKMFLNKHKDKETLRFRDLDASEKYWYVMLKTANYFKKWGFDDRKAWSRAIENADAWDSKGYEGYEELKDIDDAGKKVLGSIIEGLKK